MNDFARVKYLVIPQTVCVRKHSVDIEKLKKAIAETINNHPFLKTKIFIKKFIYRI